MGAVGVCEDQRRRKVVKKVLCKENQRTAFRRVWDQIVVCECAPTRTAAAPARPRATCRAPFARSSSAAVKRPPELLTDRCAACSRAASDVVGRRAGQNLAYEDPDLGRRTKGLGMDILVMINTLDDLVGNAKPIRFTDQVRVDKKGIYEILDKIRATVPEEIKQTGRTGRRGHYRRRPRARPRDRARRRGLRRRDSRHASRSISRSSPPPSCAAATPGKKRRGGREWVSWERFDEVLALYVGIRYGSARGRSRCCTTVARSPDTAEPDGACPTGVKGDALPIRLRLGVVPEPVSSSSCLTPSRSAFGSCSLTLARISSRGAGRRPRLTSRTAGASSANRNFVTGCSPFPPVAA